MAWNKVEDRTDIIQDGNSKAIITIDVAKIQEQREAKRRIREQKKNLDDRLQKIEDTQQMILSKLDLLLGLGSK